MAVVAIVVVQKVLQKALVRTVGAAVVVLLRREMMGMKGVLPHVRLLVPTGRRKRKRDRVNWPPNLFKHLMTVRFIADCKSYTLAVKLLPPAVGKEEQMEEAPQPQPQRQPQPARKHIRTLKRLIQLRQEQI